MRQKAITAWLLSGKNIEMVFTDEQMAKDMADNFSHYDAKVRPVTMITEKKEAA